MWWLLCALRMSNQLFNVFNYYNQRIMKETTFRHLSIAGLLLAAASAITAAIIPEKEIKKTAGRLFLSANGFGYNDELTCIANAEGYEICTYTATLQGDDNNEGVGSRTTTDGDSTSSITDLGYNKVRTITEDENDEVVNHIHTSVNEF